MKKIIITTAEDPDGALYSRICRGFREKYGEEIQLEHRIDGSVLGGFIAEVNGEVTDVSIRAQLSKMKKQMLG